VPALSYFGRMVWAQTLPDMSAGEHLAETSTCRLLDNAHTAFSLVPLACWDTASCPASESLHVLLFYETFCASLLVIAQERMTSLL